MDFEYHLEKEAEKHRLLEKVAQLNIEIYEHSNRIEHHSKQLQKVEEDLNNVRMKLREW